LGVDLDSVRAGVAAILEVECGPEGMRAARLRITVTGGPAPLGSGRGDARPTIVVAVAPAHPWPATADVALVPWTRNERAATAGLKTTSYADNVVALAHAQAVGAGEALFANGRGELCEGTGTNVFLAIDRVLVTPPLLSGCLPGVTRALLIEWLPDIEERPVAFADVKVAEEAFLTSSTRDVQPIRAVDGVVLAAAPGPLTRRAMAVWAERSAADTDP
jgi:branched-chain amino acid aminotransferase